MPFGCQTTGRCSLIADSLLTSMEPEIVFTFGCRVIILINIEHVIDVTSQSVSA